VFRLLYEVEQRPGMYVGGEASDRVGQLRDLQLLLHGYEIALSHHELDEQGAHFSRAFGRYLQERFDWSMSQGPIAAVINETSPEDAWSTFWRLVHEFEAAASESR
jgi:hypothetical protein